MSEPLFQPTFSPLNLAQGQTMGLSNQITSSLPSQGQAPAQAPHQQQYQQTSAQTYSHTPQQPSFLVLANCPPDLTRREATIIFSLVIDDILSIEITDYKVIAAFKSPSTCITTAKLLDGKCIFGQDYPPVSVECDQQQSMNQQFGNMRLSSQMPLQQGQQQMPKLQNRSRFVFADPFAQGGTGGQSTQSSNGVATPHLDLGDLSQNSLMSSGTAATTPADPWAQPSQLSINSAPRTPTVSTPFDWSAQNGKANGSAPATDRRRTSSAFFNNPPQLNHLNSTSAVQQSQMGSHSQPQSASASAPASAPAPAQPSAPQSDSGSSPTHTSPVGGAPQKQSQTKDVPDLSLLARVPPPANPADQNPPCNTLYVGNLPPDATEAELRTLFSPQKGFRRLSFRTKNSSSNNSSGNSSHNHGPMCFVEFEDVAHATRALAELYGRALPRPNGGNGKGGIRLSFSKNPLGVRGPGNPRRASSQPMSQNQQAQPAQQSVGNYGYSNYHAK